MEKPFKIALLAAAAIGYYLFNRSTTLEEELAKLRGQYGDIIDYVDDKTKTPDENVTSYIKIEPYLDFGELSGSKWSAQLTWRLTNTGQYTYVITGIKSVITILGYTCKYWMPGNTKNFITLRPGQTAEIRSQKDIIKMYDDKSVIEEIRNTYKEQYDYMDGLDITTQIRVQSIFGEQRVVSINEVQGQIRKIKNKAYFNNKEGQNMLGEDL